MEAQISRDCHLKLSGSVCKLYLWTILELSVGTGSTNEKTTAQKLKQILADLPNHHAGPSCSYLVKCSKQILGEILDLRLCDLSSYLMGYEELLKLIQFWGI